MAVGAAPAAEAVVLRHGVVMTSTELDLESLIRDYGDVLGEARACRERSALFDFSFMSRARLHGAGAMRTLERLQPRPMADLAPGRIRYALRVDDSGAVAADLTVWNIGGGVYELMSGRRVDVIDAIALACADTHVEDLSAATCVYALQGPDALRALEGLTDTARLGTLPYFAHDELVIAGADCRVGRLGYTGEPGFEIVAARSDGPRLWARLAERARPAGFASADCLRIEAGLILFLNECAARPTPAELGLSRFAPVAAGEPRMRLVCFRCESPSEPVLWRPRAETLVAPRRGTVTVTSAARSVVTDGCLGLGFVQPADAAPGQRLEDAAGDFTRIELVSLPFYDPGKRRPRAPWGSLAGASSGGS